MYAELKLLEDEVAQAKILLSERQNKAYLIRWAMGYVDNFQQAEYVTESLITVANNTLDAEKGINSATRSGLYQIDRLVPWFNKIQEMQTVMEDTLSVYVGIRQTYKEIEERKRQTI